MLDRANREVLAFAFWGNFIISSATVLIGSAVATLVVLDIYINLGFSMMTINRVMGPLLLILLFWSEWVLMAVVRQTGAPPTIGRVAGYCFGIGHYLLFFLVWATLRYCLRDYFTRLDGIFPGRASGFSEYRFDYAIGILCFYSHLLIRAWEKLWAVVVHNCAVSTESTDC